MAKHIEYIDGLKGVCGLWICLFHYLLAFASFGYIGWESGIADTAKADYYFRYFPYSVLTNGSFPLYIFFAIIGFIPALRYFRTGDEKGIKRQAVTRYFRLMPPVLACALIAYGVYCCGGFFNQKLGILLGNNWDKAFYTAPLSLTGAFANGVFYALWNGNSDYCSVLWCMNVIIFGSYLSYGILLFFGLQRRRFWLYGALFLLSFAVPMYTAFLGGIVAADLTARRPERPSDGKYGWLLLTAGVIVGNFPEVWLPSGITVFSAYGIGAFLLLLGCAKSLKLQALLANRWLVRTGVLSFALILTHFTVLMSFSACVFLKLHAAGMGYGWIMMLTLAVSVPVVWFAALIFEAFIERPTERFAHWVYSKFSADENICTMTKTHHSIEGDH